MDKLIFERDILDVLSKYGYKTRGIQKLEILIDNPDEIPKINIQYLYTDLKEKE
jgi:hypothetical protein